MRLLIVETSPSLALLLRQAFRDMGLPDPTYVTDLGAVEQLADSTDLVITDGRASHYEAQQVVRRLRASPRSAALPIVLMTSRRSQQDLRDSIAVGVDCCIVKPFDPSMLRHQMEIAIHSRRVVPTLPAFLQPPLAGIIQPL